MWNKMSFGPKFQHGPQRHILNTSLNITLNIKQAVKWLSKFVGSRSVIISIFIMSGHVACQSYAMSSLLSSNFCSSCFYAIHSLYKYDDGMIFSVF
jgi:hypothetical protein